MHDSFRAGSSTFDIFGSIVSNLASCSTLSAADLVNAAYQSLDGLTLLVNVFCPAAFGSKSNLLAYADELMERCNAAAEKMAASGKPGCIVNQSMLPAIYAGTDFEDQMSILRGAIVGVVRSVARRYGKQSVRCIGVQTGLIDVPECREWISEKLKQADIPGKRWGTPTEVAKLIAFLALDGTYITGQTIVLDGGLTSGITGT
jgi:NAD(P)-dependent dehydrogenase (short-subunit alcohol dehydrogenase family)